MKKTLLTTVAVTMLFSSYAMAAKVTYEDAVKSSSDFYEANNAVNKTPSPSGIGPDETQTGSSANQMGRWVKIGGSTNSASAGEYSVILAPSAVGKSCLKGQKGLIMDKGEVCTSFSSSDRCLSYSDNGMLVTSGAKAECR
ncbi:hypothetical protein SL034_005275 [Vibrio harveyi]|nr:hypothetical protein [Vibrio harveyi]